MDDNTKENGGETSARLAGSVGNGCWNCKHEQEQDDIYCDVCVACDWFSNWEKPNRVIDGKRP